MSATIAYSLGLKAHNEGLGAFNNPYNPYSEPLHFDMWMEGWKLNR